MNKYKYLILLFLLASCEKEGSTNSKEELPSVKKTKRMQIREANELANKLAQEKIDLNEKLLKTIYDGDLDGDLETIIEALEKGADVNAQSRDYGYTVLMWAAYRGHLEVMNVLLLDYEADVNIQDDEGNTALMKAVGIMRPEVVRVLLDNGANVHIQNNKGETALTWISVWWRWTFFNTKTKKIVNLLKEHGATE